MEEGTEGTTALAKERLCVQPMTHTNERLGDPKLQRAANCSRMCTLKQATPTGDVCAPEPW